ncbi:MAG: putative lipid II flippase FtsW [Polyangiaceae bacterium]
MLRGAFGAIRGLFAPSPRSGPFDTVLMAVVIALLGFGVVMVFSASAYEGTVVFRDAQYFLKRQAMYAGGGVILMLIISKIDYQRLQPFTHPILGLCVALMLLSITGLGHSGGGATRWLKLGPINVQPSEVSKLGVILWMAYSLGKKREKVRQFSYGFLPHLIVAGIFTLLCLKQPDFGGAVVLLTLTAALMFIAGVRWVWFIPIGIVGGFLGFFAVRFKQYRWERIQAWQDMMHHRHDLAYQPFQSVMSFGSGDLTGLGLGKGYQVLYLPEAHNDFISAIVGEELGYIGIALLLLTYVLLVSRGIRAALNAEDEYGSYIAFGISLFVGIQALWNVAVAMAILPTKGLTLPLVSYGGSSLLVTCAAMGVLLNVSRQRVEARNTRIADAGPAPEVSAMLVTEAGFGPEAAHLKADPGEAGPLGKPAEAV